MTPDDVSELKVVLWFHEYDDLDVEVGELRWVNWGLKKEDYVEVKVEDLVMEDVKLTMKLKLKVKAEDVDGYGEGGVTDGL